MLPFFVFRLWYKRLKKTITIPLQGLSRLPFEGRGTTKWWWDSRCLLECFSVITATTLNQQRKPLRHDFVVPPPLIVEALLLPFLFFGCGMRDSKRPLFALQYKNSPADNYRLRGYFYAKLLLRNDFILTAHIHTECLGN